jgi:hypothetical protein
MRDDEKKERSKCFKKRLVFVLELVIEDAEFSSARLSGVVRFWGVRKGRCSLPTYCSSDHALRPKNSQGNHVFFACKQRLKMRMV